MNRVLIAGRASVGGRVVAMRSSHTLLNYVKPEHYETHPRNSKSNLFKETGYHIPESLAHWEMQRRSEGPYTLSNGITVPYKPFWGVVPDTAKYRTAMLSQNDGSPESQYLRAREVWLQMYMLFIAFFVFFPCAIHCAMKLTFPGYHRWCNYKQKYPLPLY